MKNIAVVESNGKLYKSNTIIVNNKCYEKKCKSKMIYYDEDCKNKYKIKIIKCTRKGETKYKIYITIYCKETNKKYKLKFKM